MGIVSRLVKGSFVRGQVQSVRGERIGVISDHPVNGSAYVRWLTGWEPEFQTAKYYAEFIHLDTIQELTNSIHPGLEALRKKVMRGI